jgi:hypothetical protein
MISAILAAVLLQPASTYLIVDGLPIGRYVGKKWASCGDGKPALPSKTVYDVGLTTAGKTRTYKGLVMEEGPGSWFVDFEGQDYGLAVYLCGRKPTRKRVIEKLPAKNAVYEKELQAYFDMKGLVNFTPQIKQILRADLDGDGSKEVLIEAGTRNEPPIGETTRKDYSLILLRHVVKGKVVTETISMDTIGDEEGGMMYLNRIRSIADLDGDGNMEIVASSDYYEGQSASIWRLKSGKVAKLAENGAGV